MGKYLTNTEAYTKLGATYSGSKGNWFATKEDVMDGGGDGGALTSYSFGQFIPEEDIRAAPFIKMEGNDILVVVPEQVYEFLSPIDSAKALMFGITIASQSQPTTGSICRILDQPGTTNAFFNIIFGGNTGRSILFFPGTDNAFTVQLSGSPVSLDECKILIMYAPGTILQITYNGTTIYKEKVTLPSSKYGCFILGPILAPGVTVKQFSLNATKY